MDIIGQWNAQPPHLTALDAFERFSWSVLPLDLEKKPPLTGGAHEDGSPKRLAWRSYQEQPADRRMLLMWARRYRPAAWAVITGVVSGIIVLDFDGEEGRRILMHLGLTPHVQTGSGGAHVYLMHPGWPVETRTGRSMQALRTHWPGLDIRADGGYAAFCGQNKQGPYTWLREPVPEPIECLPRDLRQVLGLLQPPSETSGSQSAARGGGPDIGSAHETQLLEKAVLRIGREGRNNAGFWLACQLRNGGVAESVAQTILREYVRRVPQVNTKGQREPYTEHEAMASLRSAYSGIPRSASPASTIFSAPTVDLDFVIDCFRKDEWGDAQLFARVFLGQCVYDHGEKAWYLWQGHYWKRDDIGRVRHLVSGTLASVYLQAAADLSAQEGEQGEEDEHEQETARKKLMTGLTKRAFALRSLSRNTHILAFASTDPHLALTSDCWDTNPWCLGTRDGVLDLKTGRLRDGVPTDYIRTIIPTVWQGMDAQAPRFVHFLEEIFGDRDEVERRALITFLQRVLGYGITGKVSEHLFLLLYGEEGRNGKDTLMSVLHAVLGNTVGAVSNDVILSTGRTGTPGAAKPHLCSLQGKRIVWASETDKGARFDIGQVKFLTGGGTIPARQLYGKEYTFEPSHLLLLLTNNKPHADAKDKAFWERLCPVLFRLRFVEMPLGPLERKRDPDLSTTLLAEASGILAWLVRGCLDWQREGLQIPESVLHDRMVYREEEDTLHHFLTDCCVVDPQARVKSSHLFTRYKQWAKDNNIGKEMSSTNFGLEMKRFYKPHRNNQGIYYLGLGLLSADSVSEVTEDAEARDEQGV